MNEQSHNSNMEDNIEPELEARIIALVLGEASDFETEELHRLIAQRPELAAFKQRMESVHGLLNEVGTGEFEAPSGEWKLPSNKRNAVLAAIRGEATLPAAIQGENPAVTHGMSARRRWRWKLATTLGGACLAGVIGVMAWPTLFVQSPAPTLIVSNERDTTRFDLWGRNQVTFQDGSITNTEDWYASDFSTRTRRFGMPADASISGQEISAADADGLIFGKTSTDALSAIHDTLDAKATLSGDTYLDDDVQYFDDGPKFKLSNESVVQQTTSERERRSRFSSSLENEPAAKPQAVGADELVAKAEESSLNLPGDVSVKEMQDLGILILKGNEADVEEVESLVEKLDREQAVAQKDAAPAVDVDSPELIAKKNATWMFQNGTSNQENINRLFGSSRDKSMPEPQRAGGVWLGETDQAEVTDRHESMLSELATPEIGPVSGLAIIAGSDQPSWAANSDSEFTRMAGPIAQTLRGVATPEIGSASGQQADDGLALLDKNDLKTGRLSELKKSLSEVPIVDGFDGPLNATQNWESDAAASAVDHFRLESGKQIGNSESPVMQRLMSDGEQSGARQYNFQVVPQAEEVVANSALPQLTVPDSESTSPGSVNFDFNIQDTLSDPTGVRGLGSRLPIIADGRAGGGETSRPMSADGIAPEFEPPVEGLWLDLAMPRTTIPDGGSVILGGVARPSVTFSSPGDVAAVAVPEMTVTPRIIIGEEEKPLMLGVSPDRALGLFEDGTTRANGQADSPTPAGGMGGGGFGGGGTAANSVASKDSTVRSIELQRSSPAELLGQLGDTLSRGTDVDANADASGGEEGFMSFSNNGSGNAPNENLVNGVLDQEQFTLTEDELRLFSEWRQNAAAHLGQAGELRGFSDGQPQVVVPSASGTTAIPELQSKSDFSSLTRQYNELMEQGRAGEAELVAGKAIDLRPNLPEAIIMEEKAKLQQQIARIEEIKEKKANYLLDALNKVDLAISGPTEDINFPDAKSWSELVARRSKHGSVVGTRGENESTIEKSLGEKTSLHFEETPLTDVVRHIATTHGINIVIDAPAIEAKGFTSGRKVSINVDGITLRSALNLLLDQAGGLVYDIENEVLTITNRDGSTKVATSALAKATSLASLNEQTAAEEAFSTFSLHVSDVSFKLALAALAKGEWPEAAKVRIEEFVNAFDYGDPMPANDEKVACAIEQSIHPFVQQRNMLRVSMRTAAAGRASQTPLRLTFVLDNSGSMERIDRQQTVRRAFAMLAQQLTPIDQITLISFARQPRLLADKVGGADAVKLVGLIDELPSEGGTNIEAALQLAFEKAREQQTSSAQNRIILLTDGAVNLGNANPESLSQMVTAMRNSGIAFDAAGISADGLNDEVLEALARKGDGRYYLLDSQEAADDGFAKQIAGALRPSAKNVKVQVEFNPKRVGHYKLLGFEKHILKKEDFRNDSVDAAEMAAAEAGVAMYQFEALPDGEGDVGSVSVRFQDLSTGEMVENRWPIPYEADAARPDQAAGSLRVATSAAMLAAKLRGEALGESVDLQVLSGLMSGLPEPFRDDTRVQQLQQMIEQARQLSGK